MNNAYGSHGITFSLVSTDFTVNNNWATGNYDSQMKPALRKGTYSSLNVYFLSDLSGGLLGICPFPTNASPGSSAYQQNGCEVLADSLPGGSATAYNKGGTAAHEIGHWFGLFHVFQGQVCVSSSLYICRLPFRIYISLKPLLSVHPAKALSRHVPAPVTRSRTHLSRRPPRVDALPQRIVAPVNLAWTASIITWTTRQTFAIPNSRQGRRRGCSRCGICTGAGK